MWYTKEFGELTGVSVRTLHYYDKIDLLKPSVREANGYRMYSESDLLRQQKIVALKSFGFKLTEIKRLLLMNVSLEVHLNIQVGTLEEKVELLKSSISLLKKVINEVKCNEYVSWNKIVELIKGYNMTTEIDKNWASTLNEEELEQHESLTKELLEDDTRAKHLNKLWENICSTIKLNLNKNPDSKEGRELAIRMNDLQTEIYGDGDRYSALKRAVWEFQKSDSKSFGGFSAEIVSWIDRARLASGDN